MKIALALPKYISALFSFSISLTFLQYKYTRFGNNQNKLYNLDTLYNNDLGANFLDSGYTSKNVFKLLYSKLIFKNIFIDIEYQRLNYIYKVYQG